MDIEVKTEYLRKVVSCASRATASKAIQPILGSVLLSCENGSLVVSATDLDISIECKLPAQISNPGRITLPAKKLDEIVSKIPGEEITFSIDENKLTKIISNRSRFQISGASPEDFPKVVKKTHEESTYEINQDELLQAVLLTTFAASRFESNSILSGVNFEIQADRFEIGATDGSRLARYIGKLKSKTGDKVKQSVVIPSRALVELERLITNFKEGNDTVSFYFMPGQIIFQNNDFTLGTRLIDGVFPAYDKLIPNEQSQKAIFLRAELLSALERVAILSNERTSVIKLSIEGNGKTAQLSANSPDYGNATDEVEINYTGGEVEVAFNYKYLSDVLRNLKSEKVFVELENSLSPVLVKPTEEVGYSYTYLIMPVQLR